MKERKVNQKTFAMFASLRNVLLGKIPSTFIKHDNSVAAVNLNLKALSTIFENEYTFFLISSKLPFLMNFY